MSLKGLEHKQRDPTMAQRILDAIPANPAEPVPTAAIVRATGYHKSTVVNHLYTLKKQGRILMEGVPGAGGRGRKHLWKRAAAEVQR